MAHRTNRRLSPLALQSLANRMESADFNLLLCDIDEGHETALFYALRLLGCSVSAIARWSGTLSPRGSTVGGRTSNYEKSTGLAHATRPDPEDWVVTLEDMS